MGLARMQRKSVAKPYPVDPRDVLVFHQEFPRDFEALGRCRIEAP